MRLADPGGTLPQDNGDARDSGLEPHGQVLYGFIVDLDRPSPDRAPHSPALGCGCGLRDCRSDLAALQGTNLPRRPGAQRGLAGIETPWCVRRLWPVPRAAWHFGGQPDCSLASTAALEMRHEQSCIAARPATERPRPPRQVIACRAAATRRSAAIAPDLWPSGWRAGPTVSGHERPFAGTAWFGAARRSSASRSG